MSTRIKKNKDSFKAKTIQIALMSTSSPGRISSVTDGAVVMAFTLSRPAYEAFETMLMPFKDSTVRVAYEAGPSGFELNNQLTPFPETSSGPENSNAAIGFPNEQPARFSTCQEFDITFLLGMTSANSEIKVIRIFDS